MVLRPRIWPLFISMTGMLGSVKISTPEWITAVFGLATGLAYIHFVVAYWYCFWKDRDSLRMIRRPLFNWWVFYKPPKKPEA